MNANFQPGLPKLLWTIATGSLILIAMGAGVQIYQQWNDRQQETQAFEALQSLATEAKYEACLDAAVSIPPTSRYYNAVQDVFHDCILGAGQQSADQGDTRSALIFWLSLSEEAKNYNDAQQRIEEVSTDLIDQAQAQVEAGDLDEAILILAQIPSEAPATATAQALRDSWRTEWRNNEAALQSAQTALEKGQWLTAKESLAKVTLNPYWQTRIAPLEKEAEAGIDRVLKYEQEQAEKARQPEPVASESSPSFNDRLESLAETYMKEGVSGLEAWSLACETMGGTIVDEGPDSVCNPP